MYEREAMHDAVIGSRRRIIGVFHFDLASDTDSIDSRRHRMSRIFHLDLAIVGVVETDVAMHDAVIDYPDSIEGSRRRIIGIFHLDLAIVGVVETDVTMHDAVIDSVDCLITATNQSTPLVIERINIRRLRLYER